MTILRLNPVTWNSGRINRPTDKSTNQESIRNNRCIDSKRTAALGCTDGTDIGPYLLNTLRATNSVPMVPMMTTVMLLSGMSTAATTGDTSP